LAQRITLPVLGGAMAPYGSHAPQLQTGNVSENWHYDVTDVGKAVDTTAAVRAQYPFALCSIRVKNVATTVSTHYKGQMLYLSINSAAVDALAG